MPRLVVLSLASCEDATNVTKVTNETTGMEIAASVDSLGTCNLASVGKDGAGVVRFACGTSDTITLYKALCGDNAYDSAKSYCYSNDTANCTKYGHLYLGAAAMDSVAVFSENGKGCDYVKTCSASKPVRGVCPEGWHLPDTTEWNAFEKFVADSCSSARSSSLTGPSRPELLEELPREP